MSLLIGIVWAAVLGRMASYVFDRRRPVSGKESVMRPRK